MSRVKFKYPGAQNPSFLVTLPPSTENRYLRHSRQGDAFDVEFTPQADGLTHNYAIQIFDGIRTATRQVSLTCQPACQPPTGGSLQGSDSMPQGGEVVLTVTGISGQAPFSYSWEVPAGLVAIEGGSSTHNYIRLRGFTQGTHPVKVTVANGCGNRPITLAVKVNPPAGCSLSLQISNSTCVD
ncbi:hypothetical protein GCM10028806_34210 [Spirosoma terrae]|uniref:PKD-like domain-containing protein n=1 Tax=Spirosoma terrae TaxID=1968276 RepID=A0A6L9L5G9_9BACT|nr:hypothetical protein [Spirosoma terrae]NDU95734.1 hypothetical protein [Spirosoma terrae]